MFPSRALAARVAIVALAAVVLALAPAVAAEAADEVTVGTDGVTWGSTLSGPLFGTIVGFVPEESRDATLWVKNSSPYNVAVRVTLDSATWTDQDYAAALSLGASAPGATGSTTIVASTAACRVLLSGVILSPGESIPVTMTLTLGSLTGRTGQDATVTMNLGVTVFDTAGSTAPSDCSTPTVIVPLTPRAPAVAPAAPVLPTAEPTEEPSPRPTPRPTETVENPLFVLAAMVGFSESPLLWLVAAALIGGAFFYVQEYRPWRRRLVADAAEDAAPLDER